MIILTKSKGEVIWKKSQVSRWNLSTSLLSWIIICYVFYEFNRTYLRAKSDECIIILMTSCCIWKVEKFIQKQKGIEKFTKPFTPNSYVGYYGLWVSFQFSVYNFRWIANIFKNTAATLNTHRNGFNTLEIRYLFLTILSRWASEKARGTLGSILNSS